MLICPLLLIVSSSLTVFITGQVTVVTEKIEAIGRIAPLVLFLFKFLPYGVIWISFTFIYFWMPNTKVRFSSSVVAGVAAGTLFQIAQWIYIVFQIGFTIISSISTTATESRNSKGNFSISRIINSGCPKRIIPGYSLL